MALEGASREAQAGSSRDLERGTGGGAAAAARPALSDRPRRLVESCCPYVGRWLGTLGYDQALVVRDKTHLFLYLTCAVSLSCSLMWISDVWSGGCLIQEPWLDEAEKWAAFNCIFEVVGAVIFLGTLRDSIQMIGNYDNEHQELLQRKNQMMAQLQNQVMDALHKAQQNADDLCKMLFEMYEAKISNHVKVLFKNVLPTLHRNCDLEVLQKITYLLGCNLGEPGQLAVALYGPLLDAYKKMGLEADTASTGPPAFWAEWLQTRLPKDMALVFREPGTPHRPLRTHSTQSTASLLSTRSAASVVTAPAVLLAEPSPAPAAPASEGQQVFEPLRSVVGLAEAFTRSTLFRKQAAEVPDKLLGCGRSPWHEDGDSERRSCCCVPRLLAHAFKLICCPCVCLCDLRCERAFAYPKKVTLGCFWFQIVSKLHERLVHGLILSVTYVAIYIWRSSMITEGGCPDNANFTQCFWDMVRRSCMMLALLLQIPALFFCLIRIKELDAIIRIMADIRKLEDIRGVVRNLDENVQLAVEKRSLVEALDQRVLVRVNVLQKFRQHLYQTTAHRGSAQGLLEFLELTDETLGPAKRWMELPSEERARRSKEVKEASGALVERDFQPAREVVPTGPSPVEIRLPENASGEGAAGRKKPFLRG